jgi:decaprenyl-phosphate phosphoribosyltransferase
LQKLGHLTDELSFPSGTFYFFILTVVIIAMRPVFTPYIKIARFDHWFKNIFMFPGVIVAFYAQPDIFSATACLRVFLALVAVGFVASSNYILNELLDAKFDALHPVKKFRPIPSGLVNKRIAVIQWLFFAFIGFICSAFLGTIFLTIALSLWIMGCIYNIPPIRSKDKPYIDVLSESVNNPIRLLLGWYATGIAILPPTSLLLAYWMVGAFFMAIKRLAEFRMINNPATCAAYRQSFAYYTEERLLQSIIYYATAFGLFFGIFLIRYRMELILSIPFISGFMAWYLHLGFLKNSPAQYPERLYKQRGFVIYCLASSGILLVLLFLPMHFLYELFKVSFLPQ